jgi:predicted transcriptional regulator of viral defense system
MGKSTYISANLNTEQIRFMLLLDDLELDIFSLQDLKKLTGTHFNNVSDLAENLIDKKILSRIERGKYCRANFRDESVIGCHLVADGAVAYWSALNKHGMTEQFPNLTFIQTTRLKQAKVVFGVHYKFIKINPVKLTGIISAGYGNHSFRITDIEKTFVDCFDLPQYSGGYEELIRAFNKAPLNGDKLINYSRSIENYAVMKRMGFLAELLEKPGLKHFIRESKENLNFRYTLFDPRGEDQGEFVNPWRLRMNLSSERILQICNNPF